MAAETNPLAGLAQFLEEQVTRISARFQEEYAAEVKQLKEEVARLKVGDAQKRFQEEHAAEEVARLKACDAQKTTTADALSAKVEALQNALDSQGADLAEVRTDNQRTKDDMAAENTARREADGALWKVVRGLSDNSDKLKRLANDALAKSTTRDDAIEKLWEFKEVVQADYGQIERERDHLDKMHQRLQGIAEVCSASAATVSAAVNSYSSSAFAGLQRLQDLNRSPTGTFARVNSVAPPRFSGLDDDSGQYSAVSLNKGKRAMQMEPEQHVLQSPSKKKKAMAAATSGFQHTMQQDFDPFAPGVTAGNYSVSPPQSFKSFPPQDLEEQSSDEQRKDWSLDAIDALPDATVEVPSSKGKAKVTSNAAVKVPTPRKSQSKETESQASYVGSDSEHQSLSEKADALLKMFQSSKKRMPKGSAARGSAGRATLPLRSSPQNESPAEKVPSPSIEYEDAEESEVPLKPAAPRRGSKKKGAGRR